VGGERRRSLTMQEELLPWLVELLALEAKP